MVITSREWKYEVMLWEKQTKDKTYNQMHIRKKEHENIEHRDGDTVK